MKKEKKAAGPEKGISRRSFLNPVSEMEKNLRLKKYDKFRKLHLERVSGP